MAPQMQFRMDMNHLPYSSNTYCKYNLHTDLQARSINFFSWKAFYELLFPNAFSYSVPVPVSELHLSMIFGVSFIHCQIFTFFRLRYVLTIT